MIDPDHPYFFLEPLFGREGAVFHFSRYVYTPDSLFDDRHLLELSGQDLTLDWLERSIRELKPDQELAIHSTVNIAGRTWHIPMIDFVAHQIEPRQLDRIRAFLPSGLFATFAFYHSGRSFHAYSTNLLAPKDWLGFLGRTLLINPPDGDQIVDARWVGHRLIAGYCSLRFSNNSHRYLGMPRRIGIRSIVENRVPSSADVLR